jgi:acyl carrier protein
MTSGLTEKDVARMARAGVGALSNEEGLELFDRACGGDRALSVGFRIDLPAMRVQAQYGDLSPLLSNLVKAPARRGPEGGELIARLAGVAEEERHGVVLDLLREEIAAILGHAEARSVDPQLTFKDLGFDSLSAVELRNRLAALTGLRLPATLVFEAPTPAELADYLLDKASEVRNPSDDSLDLELTRLEEAFGSLAPGGSERARISSRLRSLASRLEADDGREDEGDLVEQIESASAEELFDLMDNEWRKVGPDESTREDLG